MSYIKPSFRHPDLPVNNLGYKRKDMKVRYQPFVPVVGMIPYQGH